MNPKRFNLATVRDLKYVKTATGYECKVADDVTATITQKTTPTGEKVRNGFTCSVNGVKVGAGTLNDCKVHIGWYLLDIPRIGELPPLTRDISRPYKLHIDHVRDRIDEIEEMMEDMDETAPDLIYYANQLADKKAELKALKAREHIQMSDYAKRCPVVGTYVLEAPKMVTKTFEQAAWYEDIELAPGVYEVRADLDYEGNRERPRIKTLFIPMAGYVKKAHFPSVCGGMQYKNDNDAKEVGRISSYTLSMGTIGYAQKELGDNLSLWIKWEEDPHFYYLTEQPQPQSLEGHPDFPGEKLELVELVNPILSTTTGHHWLDGELIEVRYIAYEFPTSITRAIGIAVGGGYLAVPEGTPTPAVWCVKRQRANGETYHIAVSHADYRR